MKAIDDKAMPRRTDRATCPGCEASVAGCEGIKWLRGHWCCPACTGNHDRKGRGVAISEREMAGLPRRQWSVSPLSLSPHGGSRARARGGSPEEER